eukprot:TRINITY_DN872_c0_g1_i1.p1 TRINITY_DN872_c0_g1~~TRINITY_DN872_c0_g1_i1.p1  ORF type:complete len:329 (+),score=92.58 TRINITY_DN872_c0_g1_i1:91-1077(+)
MCARLRSRKGSSSRKCSRCRGIRVRKPPQRWSHEEDDRLTEAVRRFGKSSWTKIAELVGTKDHESCYQHWRRVLQPSLRKDTFALDEMISLALGVRDFGHHKWAKIACFVKTRSGLFFSFFSFRLYSHYSISSSTTNSLSLSLFLMSRNILITIRHAMGRGGVNMVHVWFVGPDTQCRAAWERVKNGKITEFHRLMIDVSEGKVEESHAKEIGKVLWEREEKKKKKFQHSFDVKRMTGMSTSSVEKERSDASSTDLVMKKSIDDHDDDDRDDDDGMRELNQDALLYPYHMTTLSSTQRRMIFLPLGLSLDVEDVSRVLSHQIREDPIE